MIFLDTSFLYPSSTPRTTTTARPQVFEGQRGRRLNELLVTTPQVIFETITLIRTAQRGQASRRRPPPQRRSRRRAAARASSRIHRPTEDDEHTAFGCFQRHADQVYSMVDCLSFVVMDRLGITEAWAVDRDFTHRFVARPGPRPK